MFDVGVKTLFIVIANEGISFEVNSLWIISFEVHSFEIHSFEVNSFEVNSFEVNSFEVNSFEVNSFKYLVKDFLSTEVYKAAFFAPVKFILQKNDFKSTTTEKTILY